MKNKQKLTLALLTIASLLISTTSWSHDEGHGPKLTDTGLFGGVVTAVVDESEREKGAHANLVYKSELVKSKDGTVRVYLYDKNLKKLDISNLQNEAQAVLIAFPEGKEVEKTFSLEKKGFYYQGKAPEAQTKPYNIDVVFMGKDKKYLAAFDNLDS